MLKRIMLIASIVLVLAVLGLATILVVHRSPKLQNTVLKVANINQPIKSTTNTNASLPAVNSATADAAAITSVARTFTERFGSSTNDNLGANIVAAKAYASKSYADILARTIAQLQTPPNTNDAFHRVVTQALVIKIKSKSDTSASVLISTQRDETLGTTTKTFLQDLQVELIKQGRDWKVNVAVWKAVS